MNESHPSRLKMYLPELWFQQMVLVDGMARTGKSLIAGAISNLSNVEPWQLSIYVDHVTKFHALGEMTEEAACAALRIALNSCAFDYAVGRHLNRRKLDESNVLRSMSNEALIEREMEGSYDKLLKRFAEQNRVPAFVTHEQVAFLSLWLKAVPDIRVIEVCRHPALMMVSWWKRRLSVRWGDDPLLFAPCISSDGTPVPLFAAEIQNRWKSMSSEEKLVTTMEIEIANLRHVIDSLTPSEQEKIRLVPLETFKEKPLGVMELLSAWLQGSVIGPAFQEFAVQENLPRGSQDVTIREGIAKMNEVLPVSLHDRVHKLYAEYGRVLDQDLVVRCDS